MGLLDFWIIKCTRFRILLPFWGYHKVKNGSGITTCILLVENIDYQRFITRKLLLRIAKAQILSPSCWLQYRYYSPPPLLQAGHGRKLNMSQFSLEYNNFSCKAFFPVVLIIKMSLMIVQRYCRNVALITFHSELGQYTDRQSVQATQSK